MKKIVVAFWHGNNVIFENLLGIKHHDVFEYKPETLTKIFEKVIEADLNIQVIRQTGGFIVWIDNGRFRQM